MLTRKQKINKIAREFGMYLINTGSEMVRSAFSLKPEIFTKTQIRTFLSEITGLPKSTISLSDNYYHLTDWETWGLIIDLDIIDTLIYLRDVFDCDNFAFLFSARAADLYRLNSAGVAYGTLYDAKTGKRIGRHAFNMIITQKDRVLNLWCYEPMTDGQCLVKKGESIIIGPWRYRPDWLFFF